MLSGAFCLAWATLTGSGVVAASPVGSAITLAVVHGFGAVAADAPGTAAPATPLTSSADSAAHALRFPCMRSPSRLCVGLQRHRGRGLAPRAGAEKGSGRGRAAQRERAEDERRADNAGLDGGLRGAQAVVAVAAVAEAAEDRDRA